MKKMSNNNHPGWWILSVLFIVAIITLCFSQAAEARDGDLDFVGQSLDKTIITQGGKTYTVPAPRGSGTRSVTIPRRNSDEVSNYRSPTYRDGHRIERSRRSFDRSNRRHDHRHDRRR